MVPVTPGGGTGSLIVRFTPSGLPTGYTPSVQAFATCDLPSANTRYPASGTLAIAAQGSSTVSAIPVGAQCVVSVDAAQLPAAPTGYQWVASPVITQAPAVTASGVTAIVSWALAPVTPGGGTGGGDAVPVPVNQWQALVALSLMLLGWGAYQQRRQSQRKR